MKINLTEKEASEKYGPSVHWFRRARCLGNGPRYIKLEMKVLYPLDELDAFFASHIKKGTKDPSEREESVKQ